MIKIGSLTLKSRLILAPLSGTSDLPFRRLTRDHGCRFAFYEMLDSSALVHAHKRTLKMLESNSNDEPIGAQILGSDPGQILDACQVILANSTPHLIDLNCACPAKKILRKKAGAYFLREPKKAGKIIKKLASLLPIPVTVKVRLGLDKNSASEGLKLAKMAQENGASAVFFHGRTVEQGYAERVNYEAIKETKQALEIPVFGSGDILSEKLAKEMLDRTGCDGLLVARGAIGSPWIFRQIETYLRDPSAPIFSPSYEEITAIARKHLELYIDWRGEKVAQKYYLGHIRKIAIWYSKGLPYSKRAREAISKASSSSEVIEVLGRLNRDYDKSWFKK